MIQKKKLPKLEFPCHFELKVMGKAEPDFEEKILNIITRHCDMEQIKGIIRRPSKKGNFIALGITIYAKSKDQLDAIYIELTSTPEVLVAL